MGRVEETKIEVKIAITAKSKEELTNYLMGLSAIPFPHDKELPLNSLNGF